MGKPLGQRPGGAAGHVRKRIAGGTTTRQPGSGRYLSAQRSGLHVLLTSQRPIGSRTPAGSTGAGDNGSEAGPIWAVKSSSAQSLFSACAGRMDSARTAGSHAAAMLAAASAPTTIDGVATPASGIRISITD